MTDDTPDGRMRAPSTARNAGPIFDILEPRLPSAGTVLEIASGSGEHGVLFAPRLPHLKWQPSDKDDEALKSIEAWRQSSNVQNLLPAVEIDLLQFDHNDLSRFVDVSAIINVNMIHISPWAATENLLSLAGKLLPADAPLYLYGPYLRCGQQTAASNLEFDGWLKSRDSSWGLRQLEDVVALAASNSLDLQDVVDMPANNLSVIFSRRPMQS